jgi:ferric-dicitrate binding protein FerR (iron transport regulator)
MNDIAEELLVAAAEWVTEFEEGENPPSETYAKFQAWLNTDARHAEAYKEIKRRRDHILGLAVQLGKRPPPAKPS